MFLVRFDEAEHGRTLGCAVGVGHLAGDAGVAPVPHNIHTEDLTSLAGELALRAERADALRCQAQKRRGLLVGVVVVRMQAALRRGGEPVGCMLCV